MRPVSCSAMLVNRSSNGSRSSLDIPVGMVRTESNWSPRSWGNLSGLAQYWSLEGNTCPKVSRQVGQVGVQESGQQNPALAPEQR